VREILDLFRKEPRARIFFGVLTQSAIGTGAGYVVLVIVAYERFESAWAIGLVLMADVLPAMVLGPVFGAAADRWSRRRCAVLADVVRALAFAGIAVVDGFEATLALALLAGVGTGLFTPSTLAALPSLVEKARLPAAASAYGAITDLGFIAGPGLAALILLVGTSDVILVVNAVTFAASAVLLAFLDFGEVPRREGDANAGRSSLLREARDGLGATAAMPGLRLVLAASAAALFFGGVFNVGELLLARGELGAGDSGYSVLVTVYGVGFIAGSLAGSGGGPLPRLKQRYLAGLLLMAAGFLASGLAPSLATALGTFALAGFGNGLVLVYERLLIQATVPDRLAGRVFGVKDALTAWAFGAAFLAGAALLAAVDTRVLIAAAGAGGLVVWLVSAVALRSTWVENALGGIKPRVRRTISDVSLGSAGSHAALQGRSSLRGAAAFEAREHWLALLNDLGKGGNDTGIELRPRVGS
jgi:MFS family permease